MNYPQVVFFEWSDVNRTPIEFSNIENFVNFCIKSDIKISKKNVNFLNDNNVIFSVCKPNKNELIMSGDYRNLRKNFSKHRHTK